MKDTTCDIVKDLLPLYADEVCSPASRRFVEDHITKCDDCRMALAELEAALPLSPSVLESNSREGSGLRSLSKVWGRSKMMAFMKGAVITVSIFAVLVSGYIGLFQWNIRPVPSDIIEISDVSRLSDGRIVYHVSIKDEYDLNRTSFEFDENGNMYIVPLRPVVKKKKIVDVGLFNMYYTFGEGENNAYQLNDGNGREIEALYFGSKKDSVLVWKKGMELPPASAEVEANFVQ